MTSEAELKRQPDSAAATTESPDSSGRGLRVLFASCLAHITHDGLTDMLYVFFPIWQQAYRLSFAEVGLLKTLFSGAMSTLQIPSGMLASRAGTLKVLCGGTLLVGLALAGVGFTHSALILGMLLVLGGAGSSTQHPLSASAISNVYPGKASRVALSTYNFSGDIGKLIIPGTAALLVAYLGWHHAITLMGLFGVLAATIIFLALIRVPLERGSRRERTLSRSGFSFLRPESSSLPYCGLVAIGILDSATRTGFLTFLPFLLQGKGAGVRVVGLALSLIFGGGAAGKFVFGVLAARVGILRSVILTELGTAACIYAMIGLPLKSVLLLCPLFGIVLNGTSSVLYGSVPELVPEACRKEAFAVFYTFTIGAGAIAPSIYGLISDAIGIKACVTLVATVVLATLPLTFPLRGKLTKA